MKKLFGDLGLDDEDDESGLGCEAQMEVKIKAGIDIEKVNEQRFPNPEEGRKEKYQGKNLEEFEIERGKVEIESEEGLLTLRDGNLIETKVESGSGVFRSPTNDKRDKNIEINGFLA
jgi:hypothetical protein